MKSNEQERQQDHDHPHDHHHHPHPVSDNFDELRTMAIESLLIEKGILTEQDVDRLVHYFVTDLGPMHGSKIVARAWSNPDFKQRLLDNGEKAIAEFDIKNPLKTELIVLENTPDIHNVVVCTLCSCYPWTILGLPPTWYKSTAYRSRVVIDPRSVLREFGLELDDSVEIRIWDSNAEIRYLVLPERPEGTEGMNEEELAALVSRDAMIGVTHVAAPVAVKKGMNS